MTPEQIDNIANLLAASGRLNVPVPISIWREMQLTMATKSIGPATVKGRKLKPIVKQSASQKAAGHKKAARTVKGLKENRARVRA